MKSNNRNNHRLTPPILPPPPSTSSEYAFNLTRIAVSQICNSIGFTTAESPALQTLTDIAIRYLRSIAKSASDSSNFSGRTEANLIDTVVAVEDLSSIIGFPGAWRATGSLLSSGMTKELNKFSKYSEEIPFAKPLPRKIFSRGRGKGLLRNGVCFSDVYVGGKLRHVPKWLPVMPVTEEEEEKEKESAKEEMWGFCGKSDEITVRMRQSETSWGRDHGEIKWEANGVEIKREKKGIRKLPLKRGKVRFKIGNNGGGVLGVCKRSGIGKRVLCGSWVDDEENQNQNKRKKMNLR